jgi:hypothetical protein
MRTYSVTLERTVLQTCDVFIEDVKDEAQAFKEAEARYDLHNDWVDCDTLELEGVHAVLVDDDEADQAANEVEEEALS